MKQTLLFSICFFFTPFMLKGQTIIGQINLADTTQFHVLISRKKERCIGRIVAMSKQEVIFSPRGMTDIDNLIFHRNQLKSIEAITPNDSNGGVLREPFVEIQTRYPEMLLDSKLDLENYSQRIKLTFNDIIHEGRIHKMRKNGLEISKSSRIVFFPFKKISKIEAIEHKITSINWEDLTFQVDSFPMKKAISPILFDALYDEEETDQSHMLLTLRGDKFIGHLDSLTDDHAHFKMTNGDALQFERTEVSKVEVHLKGLVRKEKNNRVFYKKRKYFKEKDYILAQNRLLISPTGFGIKKGETEYRGIQGFLNGFDYGVTDFATIGVGFYPLIGDNYLTGRVSLSSDLGKFFHLSGGAQFVYGLGGLASSEGEGFYTVHLASSIGTSNAFINIAYNYWESLDEFEEGDVLSVGFSFKVKDSYRIFSDVLFTREEEISDFSDDVFEYKETIISFGGSWFNRLNKVDFGVTIVPGLGNEITSNFLLAPIGSFVRRF